MEKAGGDRSKPGVSPVVVDDDGEGRQAFCFLGLLNAKQGYQAR